MTREVSVTLTLFEWEQIETAVLYYIESGKHDDWDDEGEKSALESGHTRLSEQYFDHVKKVIDQKAIVEGTERASDA